MAKAATALSVLCFAALRRVFLCDAGSIDAAFPRLFRTCGIRVLPRSARSLILAASVFGDGRPAAGRMLAPSDFGSRPRWGSPARIPNDRGSGPMCGSPLSKTHQRHGGAIWKRPCVRLEGSGQFSADLCRTEVPATFLYLGLGYWIPTGSCLAPASGAPP